MDGLATLTHLCASFISPLTNFNHCFQSRMDAYNSMDAFIRAVRTDAVRTDAIFDVATAFGRKVSRMPAAMAPNSTTALNEAVVLPLLDNDDRATLDVTTALTDASCGVEKAGSTIPLLLLQCHRR